MCYCKAVFVPVSPRGKTGRGESSFVPFEDWVIVFISSSMFLIISVKNKQTIKSIHNNMKTVINERLTKCFNAVILIINVFIKIHKHIYFHSNQLGSYMKKLHACV